MLQCVQDLHSDYNFLHRDIKPENFRVKNNKVYLIDFGTVKSYIQEGCHIKMTSDRV